MAGEPEDAPGDGSSSGVGAGAHSSGLLSETLEGQERPPHAPGVTADPGASSQQMLSAVLH